MHKCHKTLTRNVEIQKPKAECFGFYWSWKSTNRKLETEIFLDRLYIPGCTVSLQLCTNLFFGPSSFIDNSSGSRLRSGLIMWRRWPATGNSISTTWIVGQIFVTGTAVLKTGSRPKYSTKQTYDVLSKTAKCLQLHLLHKAFTIFTIPRRWLSTPRPSKNLIDTLRAKRGNARVHPIFFPATLCREIKYPK